LTEELLDNRLTDALRDRGQRVTSQRIVIHRVLNELGRHATAEEVLSRASARLPGLSLPTVYATLDLFERLGIVHRVSTGTGAALYDPRAEAHHHLVCRRCGSVEDLDADLDLAGARRAARRRGFLSDREEVVLSGVCERCSAN
jgi:Fur family ferric uptake transcriptional regulator/Fur family peroxide stress response transcriptional regulator